MKEDTVKWILFCTFCSTQSFFFYLLSWFIIDWIFFYLIEIHGIWVHNWSRKAKHKVDSNISCSTGMYIYPILSNIFITQNPQNLHPWPKVSYEPKFNQSKHWKGSSGVSFIETFLEENHFLSFHRNCLVHDFLKISLIVNKELLHYLQKSLIEIRNSEGEMNCHSTIKNITNETNCIIRKFIKKHNLLYFYTPCAFNLRKRSWN